MLGITGEASVPLVHQKDAGPVTGVLAAPELAIAWSLFWSSIVFAFAALAGAYASYHYSLSGVAPLSALSVSVLSFLVALSVKVSGRRVFFVLFWELTLFPLLLGGINLALPEFQLPIRSAPMWAQTLNLGLERNLPTFFSSYLLGLAGVMALDCFVAERVAGEVAPCRGRPLWVPVTLGFFFLALDETLMFHERLSVVLAQLIKIETLHAGRYWVLVYTPFALGALGLFGRFFSRRFVRGGPELGFFLTGIFLWMWNPLLDVGQATLFRSRNLYVLTTTIEEIFEMWGSVAFLIAFAFYARRMRRGVRGE